MGSISVELAAAQSGRHVETAGKGLSVGRKEVSREALERAADAYRKAGGKGTTKAVARALKVSEQTALDRVRRCREVGLLPPVERYPNGRWNTRPKL